MPFHFCSPVHHVEKSQSFSPAEALRRREQRLKAFKHSLVLGSPLPCLLFPLRQAPCVPARECFCSFLSLVCRYSLTSLRDVVLLFFSREATTSSKSHQMLFSRRGAEALRKTLLKPLTPHSSVQEIKASFPLCPVCASHSDRPPARYYSSIPTTQR